MKIKHDGDPLPNADGDLKIGVFRFFRKIVFFLVSSAHPHPVIDDCGGKQTSVWCV